MANVTTQTGKITASFTGAAQRTLASKLEESVSVRDFGAVGDGVADDTAAMVAAFRYAWRRANPPHGRFHDTGTDVAPNSAYWLTGCAVHFPSGHYVWDAAAYSEFATDPDGNGIVDKVLMITGDGMNSSVIRNINTGYLFQSGDLNFLLIDSLRFVGGKGVFLGTGTGNNVRQQFFVRDNLFFDHTEACIAHNSVDWPAWHIQRNHFYPGRNLRGGSTAYEATCLALSGLTDESQIQGNNFFMYKYGIKLGYGGNNAYVENNWFAGSEGAGAAVWIVPRSVATNSGAGLQIQRNKFGNESWAADDIPILVAEAEGGTGFQNSTVKAAASTHTWSGFSVAYNVFNGDSGANYGVIYSWTPNVKAGIIGPNIMNTTAYPYWLEIEASAIAGASTILPNRFMPSNHVYEQVAGGVAVNSGTSTRLTNAPFLFANFVEPFEPDLGSANLLLMHESQRVVMLHDLSITDDFATNVSVAKSKVADPRGTTEADLLTFSAAAGYTMQSISAGLSIGSLYWLDFDVTAADTEALTLLNVWARHNDSSQARTFSRQVAVDNQWRTVAIPFSPPVTTPVRVVFAPGDYVASTKTKIKVFNPRVYVAKAPQPRNSLLAFATQTTVGAAGAASAVPATPTRYVKMRVWTGSAFEDLVVPAYAAS